MVELWNSAEIYCTFPHEDGSAELTVSLLRTSRLAKDQKTGPITCHDWLGVNVVPLEKVEDYADKLPPEWVEHKGFLMPIYEDEALWLQLKSLFPYPFAVRIAAGNICAVSGLPWSRTVQQGVRRELDGQTVVLQNYVVVPGQGWIDGFRENAETKTVRQFVAPPLAKDRTMRSEHFGKSESSDLQIEIFPLRERVWEKMMAEQRKIWLKERRLGGSKLVSNLLYEQRSDARLSEEIHQDTRPLTDYDLEDSVNVFVHLLTPDDWNSVTGQHVPYRNVLEPPHIDEDDIWIYE